MSRVCLQLERGKCNCFSGDRAEFSRLKLVAMACRTSRIEIKTQKRVSREIDEVNMGNTSAQCAQATRATVATVAITELIRLLFSH